MTYFLSFLEMSRGSILNSSELKHVISRTMNVGVDGIKTLKSTASLNYLRMQNKTKRFFSKSVLNQLFEFVYHK